MEEKKIYKLGEVCEIRSGYTPDTNKKEYWCSHKEKCDCVPWFTGKDITNKNVLDTERKITSLAVQECSMKLTTENSVLFNYLECSPYYLRVKGIACQGGGGTHILEPNLKLITSNYLYYLLLSMKNKMRIWRSGTAQLKIRGQELVKLPVFLPILLEQNQILQKFQIVYNKLFKSEVVYNDFLLKMIQKYLELGDLLFKKYQNSKIKIKDYFQLIRGKTPPTKNPEYYQNGTIKWINSGVLTNLYFLTDKAPASKLVTEKAVRECQLPFAPVNTALISIIRISEFDKVAWVQKEDFSLGTGICNFLNKKGDSQKEENATLFFALRLLDLSSYSVGSVFPSIQTSALLNMKIDWVSDPAKQKIFFTILNSKLAKIKDLHRKIKDLHRKIKDLHRKIKDLHRKIKDLLLLKYFGKK